MSNNETWRIGYNPGPVVEKSFRGHLWNTVDIPEVVAALNALQQENADLAKKAALADEEWAGDEDGFITRDDDSMGRKKEFCVVCLVSLHGKQVGQRPFPHSKRCRKARYDALTKDAITSEEIEG